MTLIPVRPLRAGPHMQSLGPRSRASEPTDLAQMGARLKQHACMRA